MLKTVQLPARRKPAAVVERHASFRRATTVFGSVDEAEPWPEPSKVEEESPRVGDAAALIATLLCLWAANHKTRKSSFKLRWAAAAAAGLLFKYS